MATNDFKIFANGQNLVGEEELNIAPLDDETLATENKTGFYSGLASSKRFNRVLRQGSAGTASLGDLITEVLDEDVADNGTSFKEQLKRAIVSLVSANSSKVLDCYPIGSIYMSVNETSPATLFGGTWEALDQGRVLIGAGTTYPAGSEGGEATHTLTTDEMPSHTHSGSTASAGDHTHTRGNMNITGKFTSMWAVASGAFSVIGTGNCSTGTASGDLNLDFYANRSWTGATSSSGSHSHTMSLNNTGSNAAHNNMQPYLSVYMWKRVA